MHRYSFNNSGYDNTPGLLLDLSLNTHNITDGGQVHLQVDLALPETLKRVNVGFGAVFRGDDWAPETVRNNKNLLVDEATGA